jgi:hypothetical protein
MSELSELFERDPLSLSDQDIIAIVTRMRAAQAQYELGASGKVAERAAKPPKEPKPKASVALLKDLGLE